MIFFIIGAIFSLGLCGAFLGFRVAVAWYDVLEGRE